MSKKLVKKQTTAALAPKKLTELAKDVVSAIDKNSLVEKVLEVSALTDAEALAAVKAPEFVQEIHDRLVASITTGALQIKAMEVVTTKMDEGNLEAAKMVLALSKALAKQTPDMIRELHLHKHQHDNLIDMDKKTSRLLKGDDDNGTP